MTTPAGKKRVSTGTPVSASKLATPRAPSNLNQYDDYSTPNKARPLAQVSRFAPKQEADQTPQANPNGKTHSFGTYTTPQASRFEARDNALQIVESLNAHLENAKSASGGGRLMSRVSLNSNADPKAYNYRYMFEKIMDRSEGSLRLYLFCCRVRLTVACKQH